MSIEAVTRFTDTLPTRLREEVIGYARSVEDALPDIYQDAGIAPDPRIGDQVVFVAGVKKLYSLCSSSYWILKHSLTSLAQQGITDVRIGRRSIGPGTADWSDISEVFMALEQLIQEHGLIELIHESSYKDVIRKLADGH